MENASKALLIAGGVLIAIIILALIVGVFRSAGNQSRTYNKTMQAEEITKFNSNFTKFLGKNLTIHEVVTICNFAEQNNIHKVEIPESQKKIAQNIKNDNDQIEVEIDSEGKKIKKQPAYNIKIEKYDLDGYITKISFISVGKKDFK